MLPVQVTIRDIPSSVALEVLIRKRAEKLKQFHHNIINCRAVLEVPQKHKHQGKLFNVRIDVTVPGKKIVSTYKYNQDVYVAIRDSFEAIERQLEEHVRKRKGNVKTHQEMLRGRITRLKPQEGFGFIEDIDGNEYYFSITNVAHPKFNQLVVGDTVEYVGITENDGHQAHHVHVIKSNQDSIPS